MTTDYKYGDRITWTEGSQMDKMTHKGIVVKTETILTIVDDSGREHKLTLESYEQEIKKGWTRK